VPVCRGGQPIGIVEARELVNEALALRGALKKKVALRFSVADVAPKELITATPEMKLKDAIELMAKNDIGFLPVVEGGKLVGVFSESDVLKLVGKGVFDPNLTLGAVINKSPVVISKSATLREAAELMVKHNIRHLPVVEDGKVVAVVSVKDIVKTIG